MLNYYQGGNIRPVTSYVAIAMRFMTFSEEPSKLTASMSMVFWKRSWEKLEPWLGQKMGLLKLCGIRRKLGLASCGIQSAMFQPLTKI